ncbi:stage II sporulation protein E domain protein [Leptospira weilii str. Ecochallenge]|nr:stage II sporulation protein E domain protein [Leptospira weilii str. Ecochallenge]
MTEEFNPFQEEFGDRRLSESILTQASKPVSEIVQSVFADLQSFLSGQKIQDDITFLSVEIL